MVEVLDEEVEVAVVEDVDVVEEKTKLDEGLSVDNAEEKGQDVSMGVEVKVEDSLVGAEPAAESEIPTVDEDQKNDVVEVSVCLPS